MVPSALGLPTPISDNAEIFYLEVVEVNQVGQIVLMEECWHKDEHAKSTLMWEYENCSSIGDKVGQRYRVIMEPID